jgi:Ca2+-binding RTX toxin-like protein
VYQGQLGDARPNDVQISADGTQIYAAGIDGNLYVYSAQDGTLLHSWAVGTDLGGMDVSPDGRFAVVTELSPLAEHAPGFTGYPTYTVTVHEVDLSTGSVTNFNYDTTGFDYSFYDAAVLSDGNVLLTESIYPGWSGWSTIKLLDPATGQFSAAYDTQVTDHCVLTESSDGSAALVGELNISDARLDVYEASAGVVAVHNWYADGVQGYNNGAQAISEQADLIAQGYSQGINIYDGELHYQFNLAQIHPELFIGGISGLAFDAAGQYLYVLNDSDNAIFQVSTSDWSIINEFSVGAEISTPGGDFGNRLLIAPDSSYFTVVTDSGLVVVDPTAPPPATDGDDTIIGTFATDTIDGLGGNDIVKGQAGDDTISGSAGDDVLAGGAGGDSLNGGEGNDTLYSGDVVTPDFSGPHPYQLETGTELDTLVGGAGDDSIYAGYGDNVDGGDQSDFGGDNLYISFQGATSGVTADFRLDTQVIGGGTITGIENIKWVEGSDYGDYINTQGANVSWYSGGAIVAGMAGDDTIVSGSYDVLVDGGDGNDIIDATASEHLQEIDGGDGNDTIYTNPYAFTYVYAGAGDDTVYANWETHGGDGNDTIILQGSSYSRVNGDAGDDAITGTSAADTLIGNAGSDTLDGGAGDDWLISADGDPNNPTNSPADGDPGHDVLLGGDGDDWLSAGYGDDVDGGSGTNHLFLNLGGSTEGLTLTTDSLLNGPTTIGGGVIQNIEDIEFLRGSEFADLLTVGSQSTGIKVDGGGGDDTINVAADNAYVAGSAGNDTITLSGGNGNVDGGDGDDTIIMGPAGGQAFGGTGYNTFVSGSGHDIFYGYDGVDLVDYGGATSGIVASLETNSGPNGDELYSIEDVYGSIYNDSLTGDSGANFLAGRAGNDTLIGGGGDDYLHGGAGDDVMQGGVGNDAYNVDSTGDVVSELSNAGTDTVFASISYTLGNNVESAVLNGTVGLNLTGNSLANYLTGNAGVNIISGGGGNDYLDGRGGADTLVGGAGNDAYIIDNAGDVVVEGRREGTDEIRAYVSYTLAAGVEVEKLVALPGEGIDLTGNSLAQTLWGNSSDNILAGLGGADTLTGFGGNDTFLFGTGGGRDIITDFSSGDVLKVSGYTAPQSVVQSGANVIVTFSRTDVVTLNNTDVATIQAGLQFDSSGGGGGGIGGGATAGDDTLTGTSGADTINGLGGNDTILGLASGDKLLGGDGNDTIRGGAGADTLTGGSGADLFVFEAGGGNDKITDFVSGVDKIDLHLLGTDASAVKTAISGSNLLVSVDADHNGRADFTITLTGVNHIETSDFIFA